MIFSHWILHFPEVYLNDLNSLIGMQFFGKHAIVLVAFVVDYISAAAVTTFPKATGAVTYSKAHIINANTVFDGGLKRFDRGRKFRFRFVSDAKIVMSLLYRRYL